MLELSEARRDGLITMSVGEWSRDKHYFLRRYLDAFTTTMRPKKWSGLHYIDLFCGPGLLELESRDEFIWGSPLIAAHCAGLDSLHLCDAKPDFIEAVRDRIERIRPQGSVEYYVGDANEKVNDIVAKIPKRGLSLAFLDPYGLHLHFKTLEVLARHRVDLIIFFPDHLDALRNWEYVYEDRPNSNLDMVLGATADWRTLFAETPQDRWAEALRELYVKSIRTLGYSEFAYERISNRGSPLYLLIFCSHHPAGSKIWRGISQTKPDGQRTLDFG